MYEVIQLGAVHNRCMHAATHKERSYEAISARMNGRNSNRMNGAGGV
jgi:hypothetical protein